MNYIKPILLLTSLLALVGCAHFPGGLGEAARREEARRVEAGEVVALLGYAQRVGASPAEQQRREFEAVGKAYAEDRGWPNRLRLALLLSMPSAPFEDTARALVVLEPVAESGDLSPYEQFAALLHAQVAARVGEHRRANQMREQMELYRTQLEGLKAVERSIIQREQRRKR